MKALTRFAAGPCAVAVPALAVLLTWSQPVTAQHLVKDINTQAYAANGGSNPRSFAR